MQKQRSIVHSDINHCYAQIEEMKRPELRTIPMAVGGHEEARHGIILAKNDLAKAYDIKTGESLREALAKCPELLILHPNYEEYLYYSEAVKDIYRQYSDKVESYGLDEAWIDLSESMALFGNGYAIAKEMQQRIWKELGLTVSIGVSYNKVFAKLASDMKKPFGLVEITQENYQKIIWPLPVGDLFYVGRATRKKLLYYGIETIGQLAKLSIGWMKDHFGKVGEILWWFANGEDVSEVACNGMQAPIKSVGNAITAPRDIMNLEEVKIVYYVLVESVASRMRDAGLRGNVITISLRNKNLVSFSRQRKITRATNLTAEIMPVVEQLLKDNYQFDHPLRSIGISVSGMENDPTWTQLDLFVNEEERQRQRNLEISVDKIRERFGFEKVRRCVTLLTPDLSSFNPKEDHTIHPVSFF